MAGGGAWWGWCVDQRVVTGRDEAGDTHAAVLSCPVDHRLVVGRVPLEHERAAEQGHLFLPGQRSPEAGRALRADGSLSAVRRRARRGASVSAAHVKRTVLPAAPV